MLWTAVCIIGLLSICSGKPVSSYVLLNLLLLLASHFLLQLETSTRYCSRSCDLPPRNSRRDSESGPQNITPENLAIPRFHAVSAYSTLGIFVLMFNVYHIG
jgi:hypothetical protein